MKAFILEGKKQTTYLSEFDIQSQKVLAKARQLGLYQSTKHKSITITRIQ